jgi:hypothetical protein
MKLLSWVMLMLSANNALAGPDATTQYLVDTPVTMMDLGILPLSLALETNNGPGGRVRYDWDSNRIVFEAPFSVEYATYTTAEDAENACATWIGLVKSQFAVNNQTGLPIFETSIAATFFQHQGFNLKNEPITLFQDLDKIFVVRCNAKGPERRDMLSSPLVAKGYSISKE